MSVYNRKMFKPRNARNALNQAAGIPSVQKFANGGTVAGYRSFTPGQSPIGRPGNAISKFLRIPQAARQYSQNPASMTRTQQADVLAGQDRFNVYNALPTIPGNTRIGNVLSEAYRQTGANLAGMGSGIGRLLADETAPLLQYALGSPDGYTERAPKQINFEPIGGFYDPIDNPEGEKKADYDNRVAAELSAAQAGATPSTFGERMSSLQRTNPELSQDYLRSLGITDPLDPTNLQSPTALGRPAPPAKIPEGGMAADRIKAEGPVDMSDPEVRARIAQEQQARAVTERDGMYVTDEETGAFPPSTDNLEFTVDNLMRQRQADEAAYQENVKQTDRDDATVDLAGEATGTAEAEAEAEAAAARTDTDPNAGASIATPTPRPENFDQLVAQAKNANAQAGVPPLASDQDEIDTAAQAGTGSAEDIKAEFLKLLPKYEEDPSIQGLNLAMMGFAIAGGESSNAMKNIADGMKKSLPAFIKSKEKRKAFERETDLLASKYAIQRKEGDRNRGFTKNDYYVTKDFVGPDNQKYTAGQPLKLNDAAFSLMEKQGLTANLVSGTIYGKMLDNTAAIEKARASATPTSYHQKSSKTLDIGGNKIEVYYPTADAPEGTKAFPAGREEGWKSFTGKYTTQLDQLSFGQKSLATARGILSKGDAVGSAGAFGKALDATKAFVPRSIGERMGLDYDNLSSANELENLNRTLALQLAKPLLQEGGKTISNFERMQVAKALGYSDAAVDSTGTIILGNMNNMFTTQADAENRIALIEGILQRSAEKLHSDYKDTATLFGYELTTPEQAVANAPSGSLGNLEQRDDGKFYFVTGQ